MALGRFLQVFARGKLSRVGPNQGDVPDGRKLTGGNSEVPECLSRTQTCRWNVCSKIAQSRGQQKRLWLSSAGRRTATWKMCSE